MLATSRATDLRLTFYLPNCEQPTHEHEVGQVWLLLAGTLRETVWGQEVLARPGWVSIKPPSLSHSDRYGPDGALVLLSRVHDAKLWRQLGSAEWGCQPLPQKATARILASTNSAASSVDDFVVGMLGAAQEHVHYQRSSVPAPAWLQRAADRLWNEPALTIATLAQSEQLHPVYLARAFRRYFGTSPRALRLAAKTSSAICGFLSDGRTGAAAAQAGGFADQSHMLRTIKQGTGFRLADLEPLITP
jgi:AraC family transcriptional regulator